LHFLDAVFGPAALVEDAVVADEDVATAGGADAEHMLFFANFPELS
jgi:hypothetical protein